jgi:membrane fusion protein (multidrug efflux system)
MANDDKDDETPRTEAHEDSGSSDREPDGENKGDGEEGEEEEDKPSPLQNPKVKWGIIIVAAILLIVGIVWFVHYWTRGRYEQATNDAYVQADIVMISPKVSGYVEQVLVEDNQDVRAGQPLAVIDPRDSRSKLQQAQAQADQGRATIVEDEAQIARQQAMIAQAQAQLGGSRSNAFYARRQADRYAPLTAQGAQTAEQLDQMLQNRDQAIAQSASDAAALLSARRQIAVLRAQIGSAKAQIEQAEAQVRQAQTDLQSTVLRSSIDGRIGDRQVRVGQYVQTGTRMMSVVPLERALRRRQLQGDAGRPDARRPAGHGRQSTRSAAARAARPRPERLARHRIAEFALLPPQNATGNFTKIVQRVPVKIAIDAGPEARKVLVPGLSVEVTVDTIGAKRDRQLYKEEARRTEDRRKHEHDAAVQQGRRADQPGAGQ